MQFKLTQIFYIGTLYQVRVIQDFGLYRISVYSGFGLDRFHCSMILPSKPLFGEVFVNFIQFPNFCRIKKKKKIILGTKKGISEWGIKSNVSDSWNDNNAFFDKIIIFMGYWWNINNFVILFFLKGTNITE